MSFSFIKNVLDPLVGPTCSKLISQFNFSNQGCYTLLLSKIVGFIIIAGGSIVKIPQIVKIIRSRSAEGINFTGYFLELLSYVFVLAYNYRLNTPYSTYGEIFFLTVQDVFILALINKLNNRKVRQAILFILFFAGCSLFFPEYVSFDIVSSLNLSAIVIGTISKIPQIGTNFVSKSTGQLSSFTVFLQTFGSLARVFTTLREVNDPSLIYNAYIAASLHLILSIQMIIYNRGTKSSTKSSTKPTSSPVKTRTARQRSKVNKKDD